VQKRTLWADILQNKLDIYTSQLNHVRQFDNKDVKIAAAEKRITLKRSEMERFAKTLDKAKEKLEAVHNPKPRVAKQGGKPKTSKTVSVEDVTNALLAERDPNWPNLT
jgi:hypothetical protein